LPGAAIVEANLSGIDAPKSKRPPLMSETPIAQRLASLPATAATLGVSTKTLWRILRAGKLPCVRIGGRTMISVADVDAFVAAQRGPFIAATAAA
jgi:excisionase family DNA binding protein